MSRWRRLAYRTARPLLFRFDSERIHRLTLDALRIAGENPAGRWVLRLAGGAPAGATGVELLGRRFRNRVGLAAGFDKDAVALRGWAALGLGFAEVGTVTPLPQPGNPRPRLFRLVADEALVNRMGFNNAGAAAVARHVMLARRRLPDGFVVGVNIGRGRETDPDAALDDYLAAQRLLAPVADYLAVNVSSPNTPGLRDLQQPDRLASMVDALHAAGAVAGVARPILVKLAPDLEPETFDAVVAAVAVGPAAGLILSNTSTARIELASPSAAEAGGLSGAPLRAGMLAAIGRARTLAGRRLVIVASGGIAGAEDVRAAYDAGADLVQLWTGLVYRGPGLIGAAASVPHEGGDAGLLGLPGI